ncbi:baseplate hub protein [Paraburkholderia elongata]|uniref:Uncharacterized protein n=1 Tax=Paraburkholderia elongata TaxID=2675747 RepID=A0A972SLG5_9BURK|nr:hypothetical protein [Paraburkholderia elongata]NPT59112.1 hypothetical protein [Paraburkholderia elongata]
MTFAQKAIALTISLGTGQFGETGADTVTLTGLRVRAEIQQFGGDAMPQVQLLVYGLPAAMINQLTAIGSINNAVLYKNSVLIAAGDSGSALTTIYNGTIWQAWGDYNQLPDTALNISAVGGLAASLKPVGASSYPGTADVAAIMQDLAKTMGINFVNNGVSVKLSNPYFPGTALSQVRECARAADIYFTIDNGTLQIWPKGGARNSTIPLISPSTGMVGYPTFSSNGLMVTTMFNPSVVIGGVIQVQSSITPASGKWIATQISHSLESETPGGQWFTHILGVPFNG